MIALPLWSVRRASGFVLSGLPDNRFAGGSLLSKYNANFKSKGSQIVRVGEPNPLRAGTYPTELFSSSKNVVRLSGFSPRKSIGISRKRNVFKKRVIRYFQCMTAKGFGTYFEPYTIGGPLGTITHKVIRVDRVCGRNAGFGDDRQLSGLISTDSLPPGMTPLIPHSSLSSRSLSLRC